MKKLFFLLTLVVNLPLYVSAQNKVARLDSFYSAQEGFFNGNILIAENGKIIYKKCSGYANIAQKSLNDDASRFDIASISKTFTSTAILQLKEKGKLKLADKLSNYFPDFPYPTISIRHLLSHTSGLPNLELYEEIIGKNPDKIITNADVIPALKNWKEPLKFQPGDQWNYSNINYQLLVLLVEKVSHLPFQEYVKKYIFIPAQMTDSYIRTPTTTDKYLVKNHQLPTWYSITYQSTDSIKLQDARASKRIKYLTYNTAFTMGDGNVVTTLEDMLKYDQALYAGQLLRTSTMEEAFMPTQLNNGEIYSEKTLLGSKDSYGLGWEIHEDSLTGKVVGHSGYNLGMATFFYRNITKNQTFILFNNNESPYYPQYVLATVNILNDKAPLKYALKNSLARIYGNDLLTKGNEFAIAHFSELKTDTSHYYVSEWELNRTGYDLLKNGYKSQSLKAFELNTLLFPNSFNVYDSYADALKVNEKNAEAIMMYQKSIALNPKNEDGKQKLKKLKGE